jgi:hypothetical protein
LARSLPETGNRWPVNERDTGAFHCQFGSRRFAGEIMMSHRKLVVLLGCLALVPLAGLADDGPGRPGRGERWAALDTDGDGAVSQAEAQAGSPRMAEHFAGFDADGNGLVTRQEVQAVRERFHEEMRARGEEHFQSTDRNGDGSIDLAEAQQGMPHAAEHFSEIDADGNGLLTREELRTAMHAHRGSHRRDGDRPAGTPPGQ